MQQKRKRAFDNGKKGVTSNRNSHSSHLISFLWGSGVMLKEYQLFGFFKVWLSLCYLFLQGKKAKYFSYLALILHIDRVLFIYFLLIIYEILFYYFVMVFIFSIIIGLQCSLNFLLVFIFILPFLSQIKIIRLTFDPLSSSSSLPKEKK